jgi:hypothetical protein
MDKLKNILLKNDYIESSTNIYTKRRKLYDLCIELIQINKNCVNFIMKIKYCGSTSQIEIKNEIRRIGKLVGSIETDINEILSNITHPDEYHCEIYCSDCEEYIYDMFPKGTNNIVNNDAFIKIHGTQFGRCIVVIGKQNANDVIKYLNTIKFCQNCIISQIIP